MKLKRKRALALISGLAGLAIAPCPARAQSAQTVRLVIVSGETSATAYYAQELGMFERAKLDVQITEVKNGAAAAAAIAGGSIDIGFSNPLSVCQGFERGIPFAILAPAA